MEKEKTLFDNDKMEIYETCGDNYDIEEGYCQNCAEKYINKKIENKKYLTCKDVEEISDRLDLMSNNSTFQPRNKKKE